MRLRCGLLRFAGADDAGGSQNDYPRRIRAARGLAELCRKDCAAEGESAVWNCSLMKSKPGCVKLVYIDITVIEFAY